MLTDLLTAWTKKLRWSPDYRGPHFPASMAAQRQRPGTLTGNWSWCATTDADTEVSTDWLLRQLGSDEDMVLGVVRVHQWRHYSEQVADRYRARYAAGSRGRRHIHGANMGFRADAYWRVGGFAPLASGEDVDLVERFETAGCRIRWDDRVRVATSDRRYGRAPGGFADHLAEVSREVSDDMEDEAS